MTTECYFNSLGTFTDLFIIIVIIIIIIQKFITRASSHIKHESEAQASHQVARRSVLIVNELGYEMRL